MKILKLQFKNLNSLIGSWSIDFTTPEFEEQGIFAITGPTGAGKSTILDAICLALYGKTPRLDKITSSQNEIMSRQTGECFASLEFKTSNGHYRVLWSQSRARKNPEGNLQSAQHIIEDLKHRKTLEDKLNKVSNKIIEITGMDFEHFTRAMLLAQGGFAKFLHSNADERSPILEKITGTQIYTDISKKVHERTKLENNELKIISHQLSDIKLLNHDELCSIKQQITDTQGKLQHLSHDKRNHDIQYNWLNELFTLNNSLNQIKTQQSELEITQQLFINDAHRLNQGLKAQEINSDIYISLQEQRKQLNTLQNKLIDDQNQLPFIEKQYNDSVLHHKDNTQRLQEYQNSLINNRQILQQVRILDSHILDKTITFKAISGKLGTQQELINDLKQKQKLLDNEQIKQQNLQIDVQQYLQQNQQDENLITILSGVNEQLDNLDKLIAETSVLSANIKDTHEQQAILIEEQNKLKDTHTNTKNRHKELINKIESTNQDYKHIIENNTLTSLNNKIIELNHQQNILKDINRLQIDNQRIINDQKLAQLTLNAHKDKLKLNEPILEQQNLRLQNILDLIDSLDREQILQNKVRDLTSERKKLISNRPCPLCGSSDHPYVTNEPINDTIGEEIAQEKSNYKQLQNDIGTKTKEITLLNAEVKNLETKNTELQELLEKNKLLINELLAHYSLQNTELMLENITKQLSDVEQSISTTIDTIKQLQTYEGLIQEYKTQLDEINKIINNQDLNFISIATQVITKQNKIAELEIKYNEQIDSQNNLSNILLEQLKSYGITTITNTYTTKELLGNKLSIWQKQQALATDIINQLNIINENLKLNQQSQNNISNIIKDLQLEYTDLSDSIAKFGIKRYELFTDKVADDEEKRWNQQLQQLELANQKTQEGVTQSNQVLTTIKERILQHTNDLLALQDTLKHNTQIFVQKLTAYGFNNEDEFVATILPRDQIIELTKQQDKLKQQVVSIDTLYKETRQKLITEEAKQLTDKTSSELQDTINQIQNNIEQHNQEIGRLNGIIQVNEATQQSHQLILDKYNEQQTYTKHWANLDMLIGSSDGKRFRNFAQGLTFELVVKYANVQLQKISDRYLLIRDTNQPLELNVVDNYQGGEIRTTKNLSGGESFVISLALALGLSKLSSNKVQIDSLFLDEGFGTLDEESLQTALDTLDSLQQEGKLIGVISHVGALKDRINLQIQVEPITGGVSKISGVGCNKE